MSSDCSVHNLVYRDFGLVFPCWKKPDRMRNAKAKQKIMKSDKQVNCKVKGSKQAQDQIQQ